MKTQPLKSNTFTSKGTHFLCTGVHVNEEGQTIDHVKNLTNNKHGEIERSHLLKKIDPPKKEVVKPVIKKINYEKDQSQLLFTQ